MSRSNTKMVGVALLASVLLGACAREGAGQGGLTIADLDLEPQKYEGKSISVSCESAGFVASDGAFGGYCRTGDDSEAVPLHIDLTGLKADDMRQLMKTCGKECRASVTGVYAKTIVDTYLLLFQTIDVDGFKVERQSQEDTHAQLSGNANTSLAACRELASATRETLIAQGADDIEVSGYFDRTSERCLLRKRFAFPAGNPMAGAVELALYLGSNEDEWLAKCSDIAGTCRFGDDEIVMSTGRDEAFATTERYMDKRLATMEVAFRDEVGEMARAAREAVSAAEESTEAAAAAQAALDGSDGGIDPDETDAVLFKCDTDKHTIHISQVDAETYQYRSWNKPKKITDKPDMQLTSSMLESVGGGGACPPTRYWKFKTGNVEFEVTDQWACSNPGEYPPSEAEGAKGDLYVRIGGELNSQYFCR